MTNKKGFFLAALIGIVLATAADAQTLIYNVRGYTPTKNGLQQFSTLVFSDDGRIIAVGNDELVAAYPNAQRINGMQRTMLPGLIDAHAHVYDLGILKLNLDLTGTTSVDDAVAAIADFAKRRRHISWLVGSGWNQVLWPKKQFPDASDIDAVVDDRPVWLERIDGHAGWANSIALSVAGIDDQTADPAGGKILRDNNGHATGVLIDRAMQLVTARLPKVGDDKMREAILTAIRALASEGITSVHDAGIGLRRTNVYLSLADSAALDIRIYAMIAGAGENLDAIGEPIRAYGNDHLEIAAVKLAIDGALGSRGAAMLEPYTDDAENRGLVFWSQGELNAFVAKANGLGFQVGIHAIGDLGNRMALDAFETAQDSEPSSLRNRIEHAQVISLQDISRFASLGVIASVQATHATSDMNMAEDRIGPLRIQGAYAWRRLLDSGATLANGSDFPVELSNPFHGLFAAVTRQSRADEPADGWYGEQSLTREEALYSFTYAAAFAAHQEDRLGSLEAGKWADFILIDRDYFTVPEREIDDIRVLETWVGGQRVFDATAEDQDDR
jgi:predicted amidohydrolase YtcJ